MRELFYQEYTEGSHLRCRIITQVACDSKQATIDDLRDLFCATGEIWEGIIKIKDGTYQWDSKRGDYKRVRMGTAAK